MSDESERVWWRQACAFAAVTLCASGAAGRQAEPRGSQPPPAKPQVVTLADARSAFAAADLDRDNRLAAAELAAAGLSADDVKLADRDRDGALRSEEYLGGLPLVLSRAGRRASPELEAEAIRLRALGAPAPIRTTPPGTQPPTATGSVPPAPAAGTEVGSAARERLASALRGPVQPPKPTREREPGLAETGPAVTRLRTAPSAAEAEARLKAARDSLSERLQHAPLGPDMSQATSDSLSGQRRRAQEAEHNDASPTAARLRAARQKLDERIRSSNTPSDAPATSPEGTQAPAGNEPARSAAERPRGAAPAAQPRETPRARSGGDAPPRESVTGESATGGTATGGTATGGTAIGGTAIGGTAIGGSAIGGSAPADRPRPEPPGSR